MLRFAEELLLQMLANLLLPKLLQLIAWLDVLLWEPWRALHL
ncbi:hypothetical protein [Pseudomonas anguilliseptica]|uniref:Uncharacterized protein n=1 Tax=Pseudomonas anguilliseptica TaxID=53406 RepID=A0A1H5F1G9_PSEAG|nr:hypothetical protein [Pseudomonas anguilliseptica]SED97212.1 hypothetical protein SAMN05421553_3756 [Pseudomonas anguilliseptica]